jgi:hypothetical protein
MPLERDLVPARPCLPRIPGGRAFGFDSFTGCAPHIFSGGPPHIVTSTAIADGDALMGEVARLATMEQDASKQVVAFGDGASSHLHPLAAGALDRMATAVDLGLDARDDDPRRSERPGLAAPGSGAGAVAFSNIVV